MKCKRGRNRDRWTGGNGKALTEAKILNAFLDFVFTCKIGFHEYKISETREKVWIKEETLMKKYLSREYLKTLDRHKPKWADRMHPQVVALRHHWHLWKVTVTWSHCWGLEERECCPYLNEAKNAASGRYRLGNLTSSLWMWWSKTSCK